MKDLLDSDLCVLGPNKSYALFTRLPQLGILFLDILPPFSVESLDIYIDVTLSITIAGKRRLKLVIFWKQQKLV